MLLTDAVALGRHSQVDLCEFISTYGLHSEFQATQRAIERDPASKNEKLRNGPEKSKVHVSPKKEM